MFEGACGSCKGIDELLAACSLLNTVCLKAVLVDLQPKKLIPSIGGQINIISKLYKLTFKVYCLPAPPVAANKQPWPKVIRHVRRVSTEAIMRIGHCLGRLEFI